MISLDFRRALHFYEKSTLGGQNGLCPITIESRDVYERVFDCG